MRKGQILLSVFLAVFVAFIAATTFNAQQVAANATNPIAPMTLTVDHSSRLNTSQYPVKTINAEAGNVSALTVAGFSATKAWQGYYGNVSGTLVLKDEENYTFYDWTETEPKGEIYASPNNTVIWSGIACFNMTANYSLTGELNETVVETMYNIDTTDSDGLAETFNVTTHPAFQVGDTPIAVNTCPATSMYVNSAYQTASFHQVLLNGGGGTTMVFTSIIENDATDVDTDKTGFNGQEMDFQMLVIEDGHDGQEDASTPYYFWIEIE
ncbi:MAG: hypothetical protein ABIE94_01815 [archaeon]